ncbi:hypothetical protein EOI86_08490 [Hwanghaeella grinnelliae]|uniref:DUF4136 domain-containing protein n=1 Tax=Hwanghaeella grinnelliae TaxID=2500179 RepID=A0A437QXK4_9PROT|nr:hypothetical protein [Hwanghaeella grinnelliae]RVU39265.1 hypothetical protein EOI86_08490 [Hwanghaeella grinnelliae]
MKSVVLALAIAGLSACALGGAAEIAPYKVYGERFSPKYQFGDLQYYNNDKQMAVDVVNEPFVQPDADRRIASAMRGKNQGARIAFTATPGPDTPDETKIVVAFGTGESDSGAQYCGGGPIAPNAKPDDEHLRMLMIYCKHDRFMSSVRGEMPATGNVDDPAFKSMLALATKLVIPLQDPFNENRGRKKKVGS